MKTMYYYHTPGPKAGNEYVAKGFDLLPAATTFIAEMKDELESWVLTLALKRCLLASRFPNRSMRIPPRVFYAIGPTGVGIGFAWHFEGGEAEIFSPRPIEGLTADTTGTIEIMNGSELFSLLARDGLKVDE